MAKGRGRGGLSWEENKLGITYCICCCCPALITGIVLLALTFSTLEPTEVGINYDAVGVEIDTKTLYTNGRHSIGPGHSFIKYPATIQTVSFKNAGLDIDGPAIAARTQDGMPVTLELSFNYRLRQEIDDLVFLYLEYGGMPEVQTAINRASRNIVRVVASQFTAFEFVNNRTAIETTLQLQLNDELNYLRSSVDTVQMQTPAFPTEFSAARTRQLQAQNAIGQVANQRQGKILEGEGAIAIAQNTAQAIVLAAQGAAQSLQLQNQALISALVAKYQADATAYAAVGEKLGFSAEELIAYIWLNAVAQAQQQGAAVKGTLDTPDVFKM